MSVNQLYHIWLKRIAQIRPFERITRLRNFARIIAGIVSSRSVQLSRIAEKIPGVATTLSKIQQVRRFLDNHAIQVREWYGPLARKLLQEVVRQGLEVRLLTDGTKVGFGHQLLMVALAYRRRAIPIAWTWVKGARGHSSSRKQRALLAYVRSLLPAGARVTLAGDCEFGHVATLRLLEQWQWGYVLRQPGDTLVKLIKHSEWVHFDSLATRGELPRWLPDALLTQKHAHAAHLLTCWPANEKEPWLLATNLPSLRQALQLYKRRMWIEEMFGDFKRHGFDLESTHLRHFLRLSRLTLLVAFLYLWLVAFGSQVIKCGLRRLVDRPDRRDLSIFRIGLSMLERLIANSDPFVIRFLPYFT